MGFSVSGAAAIIFASMFIAFGMWYTAVDNSFDQVSDAQGEQIQSTLDSSNTEVDVTDATYDESLTLELEIRAENTGTTGLSLPSTDLLIDGEYEAGWQDTAEVDGNDATELWLPGEELVIRLSVDAQPDRIKLITESAVAADSTVEEVTE